MSYTALCDHWRDIRVHVTLGRSLSLTENGLMLGATCLAKRERGKLHLDEARLTGLLAAGYGTLPPDGIHESIRHAEAAYQRGEDTVASMHLALSELPRLTDPEQAFRLFKADWLLSLGDTPEQLLNYIGVAKFNPNHVPAGTPQGGQFTTAQETGSDYPDDAIDSDPTGGMLVPAVAVMGGAEIAAGETAISLSEFLSGTYRSVTAALGSATGTIIEQAKELAGSLNFSPDNSPDFNSKNLIEPVDLSNEQNDNFERYLSKIPVKANEPKIFQLSNGNIVFQADVPANNIPGSFSRYEKIIDSNRNTIRYLKTTFAPDGSILHLKVE